MLLSLEGTFVLFGPHGMLITQVGVHLCLCGRRLPLNPAAVLAEKV